MMVGNVFFAIAALICVLGAIGTVASKSPIRSAVSLLINIVGIAALFLLLNAQFLAAIQLIVYAGAVVVLFVFVIMLLGADAADPAAARSPIARAVGGIAFAVVGLSAAHLVSRILTPTVFQQVSEGHGSVKAVGELLFSSEIVPFELTTVLLIVAVVGAIGVARSKHVVKQPKKIESASARMFHGPLMARDAQRPLSKGGQA
jgi:NADH-quinone oxidoreductase subunit J